MIRWWLVSAHLEHTSRIQSPCMSSSSVQSRVQSQYSPVPPSACGEACGKLKELFHTPHEPAASALCLARKSRLAAVWPRGDARPNVWHLQARPDIQ